MEELKPAQTTVQNVPPPTNRKRPLDNNAQIENSNYFKMRAVLKGLRPHVIEVLRTPDFQNCTAAYEIRQQMKLLMDLYKEMIAETVALEKCKNVPESQPFTGETRDVKPAVQAPLDRVFAKPSEEKAVFLGHIAEKQQTEDGGRLQGTYVVGGSAFGWNFITFPGNKAVYYGRTKEAFRAANANIVSQ